MFYRLTSKFSGPPKSTVYRDQKLDPSKSEAYLCRGIALEGAACPSLTFGGRLSVVMNSMKDSSEFTFLHRDEKRGSVAQFFEICVHKKNELFSFRSSQCLQEMDCKVDICNCCDAMEKKIAQFHEHQLPEETTSFFPTSFLPSPVLKSDIQRCAEHEEREAEIIKRRSRRAKSDKERPTTPFEVDDFTLSRFRCCWDLFLAKSKQLTAAKFPHNVIEENDTCLFSLPSIGHKMGGYDFTFKHWGYLTSHVWNPHPRSFAKPSERDFLDSDSLSILPAFALLELSPTQRQKVHVIGTTFYTNLCLDDSNMMQRWSSATSNRYFETYTSKTAYSLQKLRYMIDPGAVLHFLIHHKNHFSLIVFSNVSRPSSTEDSRDTSCRLGIDCLKNHAVQNIADNLAT